MAQNQQYASLHATFTSTTGAVNDHLAWHQSHGAGSDDHFLFWHRYFLRWLEDYLGAQSADFTAPVPYWPSNTPIPSELSAGTLNTTPNVTPPTWTTMAGGTTPAPFFGYTSLGQFKSTAELGLAIGASYHGTVHGTVGGTMATFSSPLAPIFYPWHGYVDHIWAEWQRRTMALPVAVVRGQVESTDAGTVRINLFVRRADGNLWERFWNGSTWTWVDTGKAAYGRAVPLVRGDAGDATSDPAAGGPHDPAPAVVPGVDPGVASATPRHREPDAGGRIPLPLPVQPAGSAGRLRLLEGTHGPAWRLGRLGHRGAVRPRDRHRTGRRDAGR